MRLYEVAEQWRSIDEWPNYQVSNFGRVKNDKDQILKPQTHYGKSKTIPYLRVKLAKQGVRKNRRIPRLVAKAFVPNPHNFSEVDHVSGDSNDNSANNLEWVSRIENDLRMRLRAQGVDIQKGHQYSQDPEYKKYSHY